MKSLSLVLGAILCLACAPAARAQTKIGLVDIDKVYATYYKTRDAEKKINEAREAAKRELDGRVKSHERLVEEIKELNRTINFPGEYANPKIREDARSKREIKVAQISSLTNEIVQARLQENETRELTAGSKRGLGEVSGGRYRNQIIEEIMRVISEKVRADKYDLVLDRSGLTSKSLPFIPSAPQASDFTDEVIAELNRGH